MSRINRLGNHLLGVTVIGLALASNARGQGIIVGGFQGGGGFAGGFGNGGYGFASYGNPSLGNGSGYNTYGRPYGAYSGYAPTTFNNLGGLSAAIEGQVLNRSSAGIGPIRRRRR